MWSCDDVNVRPSLNVSVNASAPVPSALVPAATCRSRSPPAATLHVALIASVASVNSSPLAVYRVLPPDRDNIGAHAPAAARAAVSSADRSRNWRRVSGILIEVDTEADEFRPNARRLPEHMAR